MKKQPSNSKNQDSTENSLSMHYQALPVYYDLDNMPPEVLTDKISRQYIYGGQSMLVKWTFKKGAIVPWHHHVNEQITWITKGSVKVLSQGKEFIVKAGGVLVIPPNVPHQFEVLEDTINVDIFAPMRQDWYENTAIYLPEDNTKNKEN